MDSTFQQLLNIKGLVMSVVPEKDRERLVNATAEECVKHLAYVLRDTRIRLEAEEARADAAEQDDDRVEAAKQLHRAIKQFMGANYDLDD